MKYTAILTSVVLAAACGSTPRTDPKYKSIRNGRTYSLSVTGAPEQASLIANRLEQTLTGHGLNVVDHFDQNAEGYLVGCEVVTNDIQPVATDGGQKYLAKIIMLVKLTKYPAGQITLNYQAEASEFGDTQPTALGHAVTTATDQAASRLMSELLSAR